MQAAHYGHIVKHLEVSHLKTIPFIDVDQATRMGFTKHAQTILDDRNRAEALMEQAHQRLSHAFRLPVEEQAQPEHGTARCLQMASGRRRMEGAFYRTTVRSLLRNVGHFALRVEPLENLTNRVWWLTRFSREFEDGGVLYRSADDLFSISHITEKRVFVDPIEHSEDFFVKEGWILMACSAQVYGLNGSVVLATKADESFFFSHDLIRIAPLPDVVRSAYLYSYLSHPLLGRVLLERAAYGSSVPHIDPRDVERVPIGRLPLDEEDAIADSAEEASQLGAEAAEIERRIGAESEEIVQRFCRRASPRSGIAPDQ